jgi:hypothetical protein
VDASTRFGRGREITPETDPRFLRVGGRYPSAAVLVSSRRKPEERVRLRRC